MKNKNKNKIETKSEENEEAELIRVALKAVASPGTTTEDPALKELRNKVEEAQPGLVDRIRKEGLPSPEECVVMLRTGYEFVKQAHALATKMGWIGVKK